MTQSSDFPSPPPTFPTPTEYTQPRREPPPPMFERPAPSPQRRLFFKSGFIAFLMLLLLIPIAMIEGTVRERQALREGVIAEVAASSADKQNVFGPIVVIPYRQRVDEEKVGSDGKKFVETHYLEKSVRIAPRNLEIASNVNTEERHRGIHKAIIYSSEMTVRGTFETEKAFGLAPEKESTIEWRPAYAVVGISDVRGIKNAPALSWDGRQLPFEPGVVDVFAATGIRSPLGLLASAPKTYPFSFSLTLEGTSSIEFVPVGRETSVTMHSSWPHPSFFGRHLPESRAISDAGFDAKWRTSYFATNVGQMLGNCEANGLGCDRLRTDNAFGATFIDPVDVYVQTERATKYGILFIALTFAAFFFFEILKKLAVHPIQYALVGAALAIFYLLLLSLAEHVRFGLAYVISALACISILGLYASAVLKSFLRGAGFGSMIAGLYGALFVLLRLETYSLVMGSVMLFTIIGVVMFVTRKIDWYRIGMGAPAPQKATP